MGTKKVTMKSIWKYELKTVGNQSADIPIGGEILTVQTQHENPCIWVLVDTEQPKEKRYFEVFGTGHAVTPKNSPTRKYIGTYQLENGALVFHLFECKSF